MKRIASLLMLAARSTLWKAAGITLASCLTEAGSSWLPCPAGRTPSAPLTTNTPTPWAWRAC